MVQRRFPRSLRCISVSLERLPRQYRWLLDGKLLLVTNTNAPAPEVVQRYKSLADIERGFKVLKSDIEIGPVYHRLPKRIRSHALVCFMALILYRVMRMRLKAANKTESPSTLLEQLKRIHQQTVQTADGNAHRLDRVDARTEIVVCRLGIGTAHP